MPLQDMYVVLVRGKGLFPILPVPNEKPGQTIEAALGLKGGYSLGMVEADLPEGTTETWVAWVEGTTPAGHPHFEFTCLPAHLSEEEAEAALAEAGKEPLKLELREIIKPGARPDNAPSE